MMRFAVVIPVYNSDSCLEACVRSVLTQNIKDIEVILIDDGSTDQSWAVCQQLKTEDARVSIHRQSNLGPSAARNRGLSMATADYITFIDSDDKITPNTFATASDSIDEHQPDLLIFSMRHLNMTGKTVTERTIALSNRFYPTPEPFFSALLEGQRLLLYSAANKFYKLEILNRHGIRFAEAIDFGEDRLFNFSFLRHAQRIVTHAHCSYLYNIRSQPSLSRKFRSNHIAELLSLHGAKCELVNEFTPGHPKRDRFMRNDLAHEFRRALIHLLEHWSQLPISAKRREITALVAAPYPAHFRDLIMPTRNRRFIHFMIRRRCTSGVRLALAAAARIKPSL